MVGVIFSILAGMAMSVQGVFNTRLSEKIGLFESNLLVQGGAFLLSIMAWLILGNGSFGELRQVNRLYLCGGVLGMILVPILCMIVISLNRVGFFEPTIQDFRMLGGRIVDAARLPSEKDAQ